MSKPTTLARLLFAATLTILIFQAAVNSQDKNGWRPVSPNELSQKTSRVEPDADAEAIFWEVRVDDSSPDVLTMKHYVRVKVFTERGREKFAKVDIPFAKGTKIKDIMARVIKPDGTVSELAKTDVLEREVVKADKIKVKSKSFAIPNIDVGVIVEYQYKEVVTGGWAGNMRLIMQRDIPIQTSSYYLKPAAGGRILRFNMGNTDLIKEKDNVYRMTMENVPAIKEEPRMPPIDEVRAWALIHYTNTKIDVSDFWSYAGGVIAQAYEIKDTLKPGKELKAAAEQIAAGASSDDDKLSKLFSFCKERIKNITYDPSLSDDDLEKIKPNKSTWDTYQKQTGRATEINELFASLAVSLGFDVRLAFGGDRSELFFNPSRAHPSFIHFTAIAVNVAGEWKYFDPGSKFVPQGMLAWNEEDTSALLLNYKDYLKNLVTPLSSYKDSAANRTGRLKLLADGTLEGMVKIEYTGHLAETYKLNYYDNSPEKREEALKEEFKAQIPNAELSEISIENITDPEKPVIYQFKVKVPNYGQSAGKRLFFQPGFFEYGKKSLFTSSSRQYNIYFHYPWSENDDIEIQLPEGYELDNANQPGEMGDSSNISKLDIRISVSADKKLLKYSRNFFFGGRNQILFPKSAYDPMKRLFDSFETANSHSIAVRQKP